MKNSIVLVCIIFCLALSACRSPQQEVTPTPPVVSPTVLLRYPTPTITITPTPVPTIGDTPYQLQQVFFVMPACLSAAPMVSIVPAVLPSANAGPLMVFPQHRQIVLERYPLQQKYFVPLIRVFPVEEFERGTIPGSINIPYDEALDGKIIRAESELEGIFSNLTKNKPVVVFTTTGTKASVIWFSLDMLGYDAKMYTYRDWQKAEREERRLKGRREGN